MDKINTSRRRALKRVTVSIVIPVYNEEAYLAACLNAIASQTMQPLEVVIVDNNSTDQSLAIADRYPFVRVVRESRQGIVFARNAGFNAARGDIIARIDADTHLQRDWIAQLSTLVQEYPDVAAFVGTCTYRDVPMAELVTRAQAWLYHGLQKSVAGTQILWGSNMAIRQADWRHVAETCSTRSDIDEDIDLSLRLTKWKKQIIRVASLRATVSMLRGNITPGKIHSYLTTWPRNYTANRMYLRAAAIYGIKTVVMLVVVPASILQLAGAQLRMWQTAIMTSPPRE
jgi:glycosyltransferase involved in cell wall biosynthesis